MFSVKTIVLSLALFCACALPALAQPKYKATTCVIDHVDDGDTILCGVKRGKREIPQQFELIGLDAPERSDMNNRWPDQPYWEEATDALAELVLNKPVIIEIRGHIAAGIYRARVFVAYKGRSQDVSLLMLMQGWAWRDPLTSRTLTPNEQAIYAQAQGDAIVAKRGLWANKDTDKPISPRRWRTTRGGQ